MLSIILKGFIFVGLLGLQTFLSTRKNSILLGILPSISLIVGITFLVFTHQSITLKSFVPFIALAACMSVLGLFARIDYRKKELNKMLAKDMK